ncbi:MAG: N-acetyltransferase, partial [Clostridia bacterium]|nr:N-acetyltransferase [Clostridia bacterium]
ALGLPGKDPTENLCLAITDDDTTVGSIGVFCRGERKAELGYWLGKSYWGKSHAILIADFYQKVRQEQPFAIDLTEGRRALDILLDLYEAKRRRQ